MPFKVRFTVEHGFDDDSQLMTLTGQQLRGMVLADACKSPLARVGDENINDHAPLLHGVHYAKGFKQIEVIRHSCAPLKLRLIPPAEGGVREVDTTWDVTIGTIKDRLIAQYPYLLRNEMQLFQDGKDNGPAGERDSTILSDIMSSDKSPLTLRTFPDKPMTITITDSTHNWSRSFRTSTAASVWDIGGFADESHPVKTDHNYSQLFHNGLELPIRGYENFMYMHGITEGSVITLVANKEDELGYIDGLSEPERKAVQYTKMVRKYVRGKLLDWEDYFMTLYENRYPVDCACFGEEKEEGAVEAVVESVRQGTTEGAAEVATEGAVEIVRPRDYWQ